MILASLVMLSNTNICCQFRAEIKIDFLCSIGDFQSCMQLKRTDDFFCFFSRSVAWSTMKYFFRQRRKKIIILQTYRQFSFLSRTLWSHLKENCRRAGVFWWTRSTTTTTPTTRDRTSPRPWRGRTGSHPEGNRHCHLPCNERWFV